jgi:hypothetical protein
VVPSVYVTLARRPVVVVSLWLVASRPPLAVTVDSWPLFGSYVFDDRACRT